MTETILTNARLVLDGELICGSIAFNESGIVGYESRPSNLPSAIDVDGDFVAPGLIEMHTDNMEKHFLPRPGVVWPNAVAAAMAHDAQMAAAGVTTVYDSLSCGTVFGAKDFRKEMFPEMVRAIEDGAVQGAFRIEHRIHVRCELSADDFPATLGDLHQHSLVQLISLMDHTPGQRQFKSREHLKTYNLGNGKSEAQHDQDVAVRLERGPRNVAQNWPYVVDLFRNRGIPIATHDDTTEEDIKLALESGAVIAEFPTTVEAAKAAKAHGLGTVAGAPNMVRGQSHFGGVSALELAMDGWLDGLSSDYVPSSLLQAVVKLAEVHGVPLEKGYGMVSWKIADMLGLKDRGRLLPGARADIIQFRNAGHTPIVRSVWAQGQRAF